MKHSRLFGALLFGAAAPAIADTCESNFQKKGNPLVGTQFTASVTHKDLTVASAIGQMRAIAKSANLDVLSVDEEGGSMLIEEPESKLKRTIPMIINATSQGGVGTVGMVAKINKGAIAQASGVRDEMCKLLNQIRPGKAGQLAARAEPRVSTIAIDASQLSFQLRNQHLDNPAAIEPRYKGKAYAITGRIVNVLRIGGSYIAGFDVSSSRVDYERVSISCSFASNQTAYALALRPREKVTLTGVVDGYDQISRGLLLKDCRGN
ncbi:hypothetical protein EN794_034790 [Mesorhizobium sp. M00.F.Ca.ET.151.01.1.1]|nr:hypothetical protein EN842_25515 [bacterium M00.F.Ca.ET.199.01.1.1]TGT01736.1 hypothetical protein EN820_29680 [bacterium M00.F.Ca.ET.177.01.1.1]TGT59074.1 hypothetical protein EN813_030205 [Mesorhizobium sp. M00.F.Ca.ET.170.01.1.1]TGU11106.1 hypothetical protein EN806_24955 [bacterium M00.F.Ca.ET.163.01.1.1]TGU92746.1 hypothetical protein EN794_034790 [Mesorhizobium sp. M00.F.Ca.ET.151.01.1.1]TGV54698.1 hypothetical protein EN784_34285 [bacterium M00.F.Ca.ET.141.01.1.1]